MELGLKNKVANRNWCGRAERLWAGYCRYPGKRRMYCFSWLISILKARKRLRPRFTAQGLKAEAVKMDITNNAEVNSVVDSVIAKYKKIDILVNNAGGIFQHKTFVEKSEAECDRDLNLNLYE